MKSLLEDVVNVIEDSFFNWKDVASKINLQDKDITFIERERNPTQEFVNAVTKKFWEIILDISIHSSSNIYNINDTCALNTIILKKDCRTVLTIFSSSEVADETLEKSEEENAENIQTNQDLTLEQHDIEKTENIQKPSDEEIVELPNDKVNMDDDHNVEQYQDGNQNIGNVVIRLDTKDILPNQLNSDHEFSDIKSEISVLPEESAEKPLIADLSTNENTNTLDKDIVIDVAKEISVRVSEWKAFARVMGFSESKINHLQSNFLICEERTKEIMKEFQNETANKNEKEVWMYWREFLKRFTDGKLVIEEIETKFPQLVPNDLVHIFTGKKLTYVGHPINGSDPLIVNKDGKENIYVDVGTDDFQIFDCQDYREFLESKETYSLTYTSFKDRNNANFSNLTEQCNILDTVSKFITDTGIGGFIYKGIHYIEHFSLFEPGKFPREYFKDTYICFLKKDSVLLYMTECTGGIEKTLLHSRRNVLICNSLFEEWQSKNIIQVRVILHKNADNRDMCKQCSEKLLYINEEEITDVEKFTSWYQKLKDTNLNKLQCNINMKPKENEKICESLKKSLITYEALENHELPTFTTLPEVQMDQLQKLVLLTPTQLTILHSTANHLMLRGSYGSGKSLMLMKKFEKCVSSMPKEDIFYLICGDQQSDFTNYLTMIKLRYSDKFIIVCNSNELIDNDFQPNLSNILEHVANVWKEKTIHLFIDEFSGSYINFKEVFRLKDILKTFINSVIVIALQSMEENLLQVAFKADGLLQFDKKADIAYQFELLQEETSFKLHNLDYSLRCSKEINEFVKATAEFLEAAHVFVSTFRGFRGNDRFVDKEYGREEEYSMEADYNSKAKFVYNQGDQFGHSVMASFVNIFSFDKQSSHVPPNISKVYIEVIKYILFEHTDEIALIDKYVICTFDRELYDSVYYFLSKSKYSWTNKINAFVKKRFFVQYFTH